MKYLLSYLRKYKKESFLAPLFKMLEALFDLIVPIVVAGIINKGITNGDKSYVFASFGILVLMAVLGLLSSFTAQYYAAKAAVGTGTGLRHDFLAHLQTLSFADNDKIGASTLITRLTADINQIQNGVNLFLRLFLRSPFIVFGSMIMAFKINFIIALIFAAVIPVLFIIVFGIMFITNPMYRKQQKTLDGVTEITRENLTGVRVVRAFGGEERETENFKKINGALEKIQLKAGKTGALMNTLTYVVINMGIILILQIGGNSVNSGAVLSGDVIALINYISQILVELVKLANFIVVMGKAAVSVNRVGAVLDTKSSMTYGNITEGKEDCDEILRFENVGMRYNENADKALENVSFSVKKGETVGIIGGTGSGKTTLAALMARFYDATEGEVYFLGQPIREWNKKALRGKIAVVLQKARLFSGTIRSNLCYGKPSATDEEMYEALKIAQAVDVVNLKPGKLDAKVEQGGRNFSGGQKQRLSIARAVISKPELLILDDSSSALDYATDAALRKALKTLPGDTTLVIISQRTSSIAHADKIIVLDDGKPVGCGTHSELLEKCEVYREIHESVSKKDGEE